MKISWGGHEPPRRMKSGFAPLDKEHERLLRTNVRAWNTWRADNPSVRPDLHEANLCDANLQHANLDHAYMYGANLERAILDGAKIRSADIRFVNFSFSSVVGTDMRLSDAVKSNMTRANLSGADLRRVKFEGTVMSGAVLMDANLGEALFFGARLDGVDLSRSNLQGAHLGRATFVVQATGESIQLAEGTRRPGHLPRDEVGGAAEFITHEEPAALTRANLTAAILVGANLTGMEIAECDFREAVLIGTDLTDASLRQCDFGNSVWGGTVINATDLSGGLGLDTVRHVKPSRLGVDTVIASKGVIPDLFIRGCGYHPDIQKRIYVASVGPNEQTSPADLKLASCFVSHSSEDRLFAEKLIHALNSAGVEYWYDQEHMVDGAGIAEQIDGAISAHRRMILICSESSLGSGWVGLEIERAEQEERRRKASGEANWRVLFPLMLDNSFLEARDRRVAYLRNDRKATDFREWQRHSAFDASVARLLEGLRRER